MKQKRNRDVVANRIHQTIRTRLSKVQRSFAVHRGGVNGESLHSKASLSFGRVERWRTPTALGSMR